MAKITLSQILDDLSAADRVLRKYEREFWMSSDLFYELYSKGLLDTGENTEEFAEWAAFYEIRRHREKALHRSGNNISAA